MNLVFETAAGYWSPLVLMASAFVISLVVIFIRSKGNRNFKRTNAQALPFFSGNVAPEKNVHGVNFYWGFLETMKGYYGLSERIHNGIVNDFVFWLVLLAVVLLASMALGGFSWA